MAIYIYTKTHHDGVKTLADNLGAEILRKFDGMNFWKKHRTVKLEKGDFLICWGSPIPPLEGIQVLNAQEGRTSKYQDYNTFIYNVQTPKVRTLPFGRGMPKTHKSKGGELLDPPKNPNYWVERVSLETEFRIHSFDGRVIRSGEKVLRAGYVQTDELNWYANRQAGFPMKLAHPWIRTFETGWTVKYEEFKCTKRLREIAGAAVKSLGLTFGAVDIGMSDASSLDGEGPGKYIVLEVKRGPSIEGGTIASYTRAITRWMKGEGQEEVEEKGVEVVVPAAPDEALLEEARVRAEWRRLNVAAEAQRIRPIVAPVQRIQRVNPRMMGIQGFIQPPPAIQNWHVEFENVLQPVQFPNVAEMGIAIQEEDNGDPF